MLSTAETYNAIGTIFAGEFTTMLVAFPFVLIVIVVSLLWNNR